MLLAKRAQQGGCRMTQRETAETVGMLHSFALIDCIPQISLSLSIAISCVVQMGEMVLVLFPALYPFLSLSIIFYSSYTQRRSMNVRHLWCCRVWFGIIMTLPVFLLNEWHRSASISLAWNARMASDELVEM